MGCFLYKNMQIIRDKSISLTSREEGSLVLRNGFFTEPFVDDNGKATVKKVFRKGKLPSVVSKMTHISEEAVINFQERCPRHVPKGKWHKMSAMRRIRENLKCVVGHNNFTFELI